MKPSYAAWPARSRGERGHRAIANPASVSVALARGFTVAALAIAAWRANAVGVVRLTCTDDRLEIDLIRVAGYAAGFAPGAIAEPVRLTVPYAAIRGLTRRGRALCVALHPAACAPHN